MGGRNKLVINGNNEYIEITFFVINLAVNVANRDAINFKNLFWMIESYIDKILHPENYIV